MAHGFKSGGRDWLPGQSGNPKGPARLPEEVKAVKRLTTEQVQDVFSLVLAGKSAALDEIINDPEETVFRVWLAKAAKVGMASGDLEPLDRILNRLIGKVKQQIEHSGELTLEELVAGSYRVAEDEKRDVIEVSGTSLEELVGGSRSGDEEGGE